MKKYMMCIASYSDYRKDFYQNFTKPNNLDYGTAIEGITNAFYGSINDYGKDKKNFDKDYQFTH